jgi:hypothetical protein
MADRPGERAVGPLIWLLTADDKRQHAFGGVFADSESEPAGPRHADEMCALDRQLIQDPHGVPDTHLHGISGWVVRLVAGPQTPVVNVDPAELAGWKRLGDIRLSYIGDGVQKPAMKDDRESVTALVLEVHLATGVLTRTAHRAARTREASPVRARVLILSSRARACRRGCRVAGSQRGRALVRAAPRLG